MIDRYILDVLPSAAIVVDTSSDRIIASNERARSLLAIDDTDRGTFSRHTAGSFSHFLVFLDELAYRGEAWTRKIPLVNFENMPINCEIRGRRNPTATNQILLLLIDLDEIADHERATEMEVLQSGGLIGWQRAQEFFSELEMQNELILNAAGEGIYGVNVDGHTTFVNRAAKEMLGWTAEDLLGKSIHDLIHHHHTDGSLYKAHDCPIYQSFRFEKTHRIEDEYFWRKDGKPIQVEYVSTPIYHQQVLAGAVVIFRDVTERKLNEKKLQEAFNEIRDLRDRLEQENAYLQKAITNERAHHDLIGSSPAIHQLQTKIELVSATEVPVLITGDTGTGKSIIANAIHKQGNRSRRTPIHFKCSSISKNNVEAELFGRLTLDGSKTPRAVSGALELAHGGTLILEEISDLPLELQSKLLVALMDRKFKRVGDTIARNLDVRVIAVSKKNIEREVTLGRFLDDLFLFLNVFPIHCIPLRERRTDIPELAGHMLHIACEKLNKTPPIITERTMKQLVEYDWPGNAKELRNVIERAAIVSMGGKLVVELGSAGSQMPQGLVTVRTEHEIQLEIRANIVSALRETRGKVAGKNGAAALLGVEPTTLYSRIKKFEITKNAWTQ